MPRSEIKPIVEGSVTQTIDPNNLTSTRYIAATFLVRNARGDSAALNTPRRNLTFVAVSTSATIGDTPVRVFVKHDGSTGSTALARQLLPTGLVDPNAGGVLIALAPDILQVLAQSELTSIALPPSVTEHLSVWLRDDSQIGSASTRRTSRVARSKPV